MKRSQLHRFYWARYRLPNQMPKFDGPAPVAAPQNMNSTKTNEFIDPIDDKFPVSIRGNLVRPDVPEDQYVDSWYVCTSMTHHLGDYRPWSAAAPANAYRFRPYNEFDTKGREYVTQFREFDQFSPKQSRGRGQKGFPFREAFLTKMNGSQNKGDVASLQTIMDRQVEETHQLQTHLFPTQVQRDVGRIESPLPLAPGATVSKEKSSFPAQWKTEDWYEYEIAKVRNRRFTFENTEGGGVKGSEVTYRLVLEGFWDHHVMKLAEDVCMFIKDVGRQIVEEKLKSVRHMLADLSRGGSIDPDLVKAFNCSTKGPFGSSDRYDVEEIAHFLRADLQRLEAQCVGLINRANVPIPGATNIGDPEVSWPHVEHLEPWVRMAEFWTSSSDTSYSDLEMSTTHYEFRKYFRVVVVKMPFKSTEFEQRLYSIRHWLHRQTSCEFHTVGRQNVVYDSSIFPSEHDPSIPTTHEHHRLFSFALDWQSSPVNYLSSERIQKDDTWESIADRVGTTKEALLALNRHTDVLQEGQAVQIPADSKNRRTSFGLSEQRLQLGEARTWEKAAEMVGCSVEELQQANGPATLLYDDKSGFHKSITELNVPYTAWESYAAQEFDSSEPVLRNDTFESVAERLQCAVGELQKANPSVSDIRTVNLVSVPPTAKRRRRMVHPQLRPQAASEALFPKTASEEQLFHLDSTSITTVPENAKLFPHEYHTATSRFPQVPAEADGSESWISYTAKYLDKEFMLKSEPMPVYNVNHLWPLQQVPGKTEQTPFEEDQTWLMHPIPVQQMEQHHPEKDLQDLPFINHEQFPRSVDWQAP
ncbi:hypothetical protein STCU_06178 [Strigomonas culicis]|uniref:LysM domain-containing protein n=1 Tax=Strigomonas culicis TaxID=28005 RepID=S9VHP5_9TRYP|nr:hypothetical protein STCU_06178 [Strigomonas culicis]|eukprot:EPY26591.1 hypothetical protein STCU_06178 [Strigomonas culicis]